MAAHSLSAMLAGHDCTQAMHLLLGVVATVQQFTFSLQLFSLHSEVTEIHHPSTIDL